MSMMLLVQILALSLVLFHAGQCGLEGAGDIE